MIRKANEQFIDLIGDIEDHYIQEYVKSRKKTNKPRRLAGFRLSFVLAAAIAALLGTVSLAAVPAIDHFLANSTREEKSIIQNFGEIQAQYAVPIDHGQEAGGVIATLNNAILEDHFLLLNYTFNWAGLEEAQDGSFHTWFLPWFFYITEGDRILCQSEYTEDLHTQPYSDQPEDDFTLTCLYCIDLGSIEGQTLVGKELTVQLLYAEEGDGFVSSFTPESCFPDRSWHIGRSYEFGKHRITINEVRESALYMTLFIDCSTIGHPEDEYKFVLSDERGNDYSVYPYEDNDINGYWFVKPESPSSRLTLKVIRSLIKSDQYGTITDDSYEVLFEIPIELED